MAKKKFTYVLGAGASHEVGLPLGHELKDILIRDLGVRRNENGIRVFGDQLLWQSIQAAIESDEIQSIDTAIAHAQSIIAGIHQVGSVDQYLDTHHSNPEIQLIAKLAIARAILNAESNSSLNERLRPRNADSVLSPDEGGPDYDRKYWLEAFFEILSDGCDPDELPKRLSELRFVVFNYDRVLEHYLYNVFRNYFGFNQDVTTGGDSAAALVNSIEIIHPYGLVGSLLWSPGKNSIAFGATPSPETLIAIAKGIKTCRHRNSQPQGEDFPLRRMLLASSQIVFLGFAFHQSNMRLFGISANQKRIEFGPPIMATVFELPKPNVDNIRSSLTRVTGSLLQANVYLLEDKKCHELLCERKAELTMNL